MLEDACEIYVFQVAKTHSTKRQQQNFAEVGQIYDPERFSTISNSATHFVGLRMRAFGMLDYKKETMFSASDKLKCDVSRLTNETKEQITKALANIKERAIQ